MCFTHWINHVFKWWTVETGWNYCIYGNAIEHDRLFHYLFCYGKSMYCLNAIKINLIVHTFQTAKYIYLSGNRGKKATQRMLLFRDTFSTTAADRRQIISGSFKGGKEKTHGPCLVPRLRLPERPISSIIFSKSANKCCFCPGLGLAWGDIVLIRAQDIPR